MPFVPATITNQINVIIASVLSSPPDKTISPPSIPIPDTLKGIDDLIRAGLEAYRSSCFNWLLAATGLVVIGLICEGPELWHEITSILSHWRFERKFHFSLPEDQTPNKAKLLAFAGWLLIVGGVAGEYVADSFVSKADGYVQKFDEILLADAQRQTELAKIRAGGAYERAAESEKEAARLQKDAEAEHLARAKIEAAVAWRSLSDTQKQDIGKALAGFSSRAGASIWFNGSSTEAEMFADDIAEALRFGHITTTAPGGIMQMRESGKWNGEIKSVDTGVVVQSTRAPAAIDFAMAVIEELNKRGFNASRQKDPPFDDKPEPIIWITVQPRPKGPQGEYKLQAEQEAKAKNSIAASQSR